jgi:glycerol-3-phosphate dehydrogenase
MGKSYQVRPNVGLYVNRHSFLKMLKTPQWDVLIIGGGATGLGSALDAASRGYKTLLLEQHDFAKATSSRSTKLIHGGLRYLQQGNIHLVREALHERGRLCENAPHLVHHLPFLVPLYHFWERTFYGIGLKVYDLLAGKLGLEPSRHLNREQTLKAIPTLHHEGLRGGALYYDGQFDDARLAITLAQTASDLGAVLLNYFRVTSFIKKKGKIIGVRATDEESGEQFQLHAKVVINAGGIFSDNVRALDNKKSPKYLIPSQGIHLVLPASFLDSKTALLVPHTDDGRVIFIVPWHDRVIIGTTDTALKKPVLEPVAQKKEIDFLLKQASKYLAYPPEKTDILSVFAGIRPLVSQKKTRKTASIARDHVITTSPSGLVSIAGGKWTTYRKMAEDVMNQAVLIGNLPPRPCATTHLKLSGYTKASSEPNLETPYGSHIKEIQKLQKSNILLKRRLIPSLPYTYAHIKWAIDSEMARTVEDILSRRTRLLLLDAKQAIEIAPQIAHFMAQEMKQSARWEKEQVADFTRLAKKYLPLYSS